jgi:hypothetical protein
MSEVPLFCRRENYINSQYKDLEQDYHNVQEGTRKVDTRLSWTANLKSHGARPVYSSHLDN